MTDAPDPIDTLRDAAEEIATAAGHYVADICSHSLDATGTTDIIIGRSYPSMRSAALRNSLGDDIVAGGDREQKARRAIKSSIDLVMSMPEPTIADMHRMLCRTRPERRPAEIDGYDLLHGKWWQASKETR